MIQSQTFVIMREPQAAPGAQRVSNPRLERLFRAAERRSGFPASVLQAMAYLESWGLPNAQSPAGPRGIMQISEGTAKRMGLRITYARRHHVTKTRVAVRRHGKLVYRTVRHKSTYTVLVRDDRLRPDRAIPAAAMYLATLERRYGGRDWAIWAYHCGEGCIADLLTVARRTPGLEGAASVAKLFFGCNPAWNRDLCGAIQQAMERDYSPTYWFRVMRAQQLLRMYDEDPPAFHDLLAEYRYPEDLAARAPDRLSVWLKPLDLVRDAALGVAGPGEDGLVTALQDPEFLGYRLDPRLYAEARDAWRAKAMPSTIGTLAYVAFETRRLYKAWVPEEAFLPLDVTALLVPKEDDVPGTRLMDHAHGQVFDLSLADLPTHEQDCLRFVLDDLGWNGDLGFIQAPPGTAILHIGCSPTSRDFFTRVFEDARAACRARSAPWPGP